MSSEQNTACVDASCSESNDNEVAVVEKEEEPKTKKDLSTDLGKPTAASSEASYKNTSEKLESNVTIQDECRTSVLIKKQMNEIDKEIHRRAQNRNIKKVFIFYVLLWKSFAKHDYTKAIHPSR